jgi:hypothetical protein
MVGGLRAADGGDSFHGDGDGGVGSTNMEAPAVASAASAVNSWPSLTPRLLRQRTPHRRFVLRRRGMC